MTLLVSDVSESSINLVTWECLKALLNVFKLLLLKFVREFTITLSKSFDVSVVRLGLNVEDTSSIRNSVSGSTITGVIEATVNGERLSTIRLFSIWGIKLPVVWKLFQTPAQN